MAFLERLTKGKVGGEEQDLLKAADAALADGDAATRGRDLRAASGRGRRQRAGARRARALLCRDRRARAGEADARTWCRRPSATRRRSRPRAPRSRSPSRPSRSGPFAELEEKVAANPLDHQARFDLAIALNAKGKREEAARATARDRQARPQMERRRRAQAARAVLRGLGLRPIRRRSRAARSCRRFCLRNSSFRGAGRSALILRRARHAPVSKDGGGPHASRRPPAAGSSA